MIRFWGTALVFLLAVNTARADNRKTVAPGRLVAQARSGASEQLVRTVIGQHGGTVLKKIGGINAFVISVPEAAAPQIQRALDATGVFTFVEPDSLGHSGSTPNDPDYPSQWHLGTIQASTAWNVTQGSFSTSIAIVDSGVYSAHPDLFAKIVPGWNFLTASSNTADDLGHGTAVAGTAAAMTGNATGVAGVCWNCSIMPLVVLNSSDYATYSDIASAITYAADHGSRIINVSIGGSSSSSTLQSAVTYAWNKGAVVFASAMNNSSSTPYYPAACDYAVAVSATEPNDTLASFSNYGNWISVSAPGDNILTTQSDGSYGYWYGTSFASPIAAATAALMLSVNPALSAPNLVNMLEQTATDLGAPGFDPYFGWGRINASSAVSAAKNSVSTDTTPPSVSISTPANGSTVAGTIQVQGLATDNVGVVKVELWVDSQLLSTCSLGNFSCSWNTTALANGSHTVTVKAYDAAGNVGSATVTVTVSNLTVAVQTDTTPPVVQITNPLAGSLVKGMVSIAVSATDNVGVSQVSIYVDGTLRSTLYAAPYSYSWNTKKASTGTHTLTAKAWDAAGNVATASETVQK